MIGDTLADIAAAKGNHVPVLAVATGRFTTTELRQAGADLVTPDLKSPSPITRALIGR
ncbi:HAD family hydrolase [[Kitasatospora] papulosa]|uniref:HAD family hydrolase n=1 Tax=[Kitasatospora] papulosa TaxID=1464011 RepID=UPI0036E1255A